MHHRTWAAALTIGKVGIAELALEAGLGRNTVSKIVNGWTTPTAATERKMRAVLERLGVVFADGNRTGLTHGVRLRLDSPAAARPEPPKISGPSKLEIAQLRQRRISAQLRRRSPSL